MSVAVDVHVQVCGCGCRTYKVCGGVLSHLKLCLRGSLRSCQRSEGAEFLLLR